MATFYCCKNPFSTENQKNISLVEKHEKFESFSEVLQKGGDQRLNLLEAKTLSDGLIDDFGTKYPLSHFRSDSAIINYPEF